ncbi:MAG: efflux RND transporter periplasmic adaptor subunit [Rhodanobacteraceae bacterium]|nr:MAG: efflux RND transporter periplasmic adaptor subunit [Rhodanobacteraceae bacterium]
MKWTFVTRVVAGIALLVLLLAAGAIGYFVAPRSITTPPAHTTAEPAHRKVLYWYDPMQPEQHFDHPGVSPMGMQMVPKYASPGGTASNIVRIDPVEVQNLGMRTAVVEVAPLSDTVHVPGTVAWDQNLAVTVSARTNATLENLYVRAPFTVVKAGQPLAEILAPEWSTAAAQYFALQDAQSATGRDLRAAALQRLHALGMDAATLRSLRSGSDTITLRAPVAGVVSKLDVQQGQQLGQGAPILTINGLDQVWVDAAIPQAQSGGITAGAPITATVTALPGEIFHGKVAVLLPEVSATTRTQRARIVLDNPRHALAPGMFADLRIAGTPSAPHPLVPTEAVIASGPDTRVIEALGNGQFKPVLVKTGHSADGMTAILAGLQGGERIVTSGQFLIDSEASLSGALQRMEAGHAKTPASGSRSATSSTMRGAKMNMPMPSSSSSGENRP